MFAGVAYHCRTEGQIDWPEVIPVACIFRNNSSDSRPLEYIGLGDKCLLQNDTLVYFCTISSETSNENFTDIANGTWKYGWELNWNAIDEQVTYFFVTFIVKLINYLTLTDDVHSAH